jgi:hypothetical protein
MGKYAGTAQKVLVVFGDGKMRFVAGRNTTDGQWVTTNANLTGSLSADRWLHLCVTYDGSSTANDPKIYITGSSVALTEESTPAGALDNDRNVRFIVGNAAFSGSIEWSYAPDFVWKNTRVYRRELSASEVATLAANPDREDVVMDGLVWHAPYVRNFRYSEYLNVQLTTAFPLFDRVNGLIGTPHYYVITGSAYQLYGRDPSLSSY